MQCIPFLDSEIYKLDGGGLHIKVHQKPTHKDKYPSYKSHHLIKGKKAVVKTLLDRAKIVPSTVELQQEEKETVLQDLRLNGYNRTFIEQICKPANTSPPTKIVESRGFTCLHYVQGVSERITDGGTNTLQAVQDLGRCYSKA